MTRPLTPETKLRNRCRDLERIIDGYTVASQHPEIWAYLAELTALSHLATNGLRRPDDLGGSISTQHAKSRPPAYDSIAAAQLRAELAHLRERSHTLRGVLNDVDGGSATRKADLARRLKAS